MHDICKPQIFHKIEDEEPENVGPCNCPGAYCCQNDPEYPQLPWVRALNCRRALRTAWR